MRATRLLDLSLRDGERCLGRVTDVGALPDGLAIAYARGLFKPQTSWVRLRRGRFLPPNLEGEITPVDAAEVILGRRLEGGGLGGDAHIADLVVNLEMGRIEWAVLSEGLWRDVTRGRRVVPFAEIALGREEVKGPELPTLRLSKHGARGD